MRGKLLTAGKKGQTEIMEYIFMTLFIVIMIVVLILFLSWFQYSQIGMKGTDVKKERGEFLLTYMTSSPYLNVENSMFDDSKLTAILSMKDYCKRMEGIFGESWSLKVELLTSEKNCFGECTPANYPCCGSWTLCAKESNNTIKYVIPVNVMRHMTGRVHLANVEVSVHE